MMNQLDACKEISFLNSIFKAYLAVWLFANFVLKYVGYFSGFLFVLLAESANCALSS